MIDLTSSVYLGIGHDHASLSPWTRLTIGVPAALAQAPETRRVAAGLASLIGTKAAALGPSTLHAFWDLFVAIGARHVYLDAGTYPIARWGAERASCAGAVVRTFRHHDPAALRRALAADNVRSPVVLTDGFCPVCGSAAPVSDYLAAARSFGGSVVIDDTQAIGVLGTPAPGHPYGVGGGGITRWARLEDPRVLVVASLAKGFGVPIAVVAGSSALLRRYVTRGETRVHCSPPSNAHLSAAASALRLNAELGDKLRGRLAELVVRFRSLLDARGVALGGGLFPIQTLASAPRLDVAVVHRRLEELGVRAVLHRPRCGRGLALSFIITAAHRQADIDRTVRMIGIAVNAEPRTHTPRLQLAAAR